MSTTNTSTDRALIRAAEPEDYAALQNIYAQPGAYFGTLQMPFPTVQLWRERLAHPDPNRRMLVACIEDEPVGNLGLMVEANPRRRHAAGIGMGVHDAYAGRGIGEQLMRAALDLADNWLNVLRLELSVFADNERAIRLYERCGFRVEGTYEKYAYRNGEMVDALAMARLRSERQAT